MENTELIRKEMYDRLRKDLRSYKSSKQYMLNVKLSHFKRKVTMTW